MAEYIDKEKVIQEINDWWKCAIMADGKPTLNATIKALPPSDVIERSKIDKAIEKIKLFNPPLKHDLSRSMYEDAKAIFLAILERNIGE